jgi:murein DD-endopeptidase MepM/ murein hydrolase activator NlpD
MFLEEDSIKTRLLKTGYYSNPKPQYVEYVLDDWAFIMPCAVKYCGEKQDIQDVYAYYRWRGHSHLGADILGETGNPILACGGGVVYDIENPTDEQLKKRLPWQYIYGRNVTIYHGINKGFKLYTRYCHLDSIAPMVKKGYAICKGALVGRMGSTGDSLSPHLHLEFKMHGANIPVWFIKSVDPIPFLPQGEVIKRKRPEHEH